MPSNPKDSEPSFNPANRSRQRGPLASSCETGEGQRRSRLSSLAGQGSETRSASVKGIAVNMVQKTDNRSLHGSIRKRGSDESRLKQVKKTQPPDHSASRKSQTLQVIRFSGKGGELLAFASTTHLQRRLPNLKDKIKGGLPGGRKSSRPRKVSSERNLMSGHLTLPDSFRKDLA